MYMYLYVKIIYPQIKMLELLVFNILRQDLRIHCAPLLQQVNLSDCSSKHNSYFKLDGKQHISLTNIINSAMNVVEKKNYKYVLFPGNYPSVIQEALNRRNCWVQIPHDKILSANFSWKPLNYASALYDSFQEMLRYDKDRYVMLNHFENNNMIGTKSGLVRSLKHYYSHENAIYEQNYHVFETIPTTFIINPNKDSSDLKDFLQRFNELELNNFTKQKIPQKHCLKNIWYIKPEASNQGRGITISNSIKEIQSILFSKSINCAYILQKAIEKPLLYQNRKFDVRVWALVTANFEIYYYKVPYMRTTSYEYDDTNFNTEIHLTNNAQQKKLSEYSKFQDGNTIPMLENLREELIRQGKDNVEDLMTKITDRIKSLVVDTFLSVRKFFLRNIKKKQFQLFGFDFLIDEDLRTWLIQVNSNPYLGQPNKFIKEILPQMINQMFEIVLDPLFPPCDYTPMENKNFELLHKQVSFYRINPLRSGSTDAKRKNYYPLNDHSNNHTHKNSSGKRRNSESIGLTSFQSTEKHLKIRYSTPVESIKYLLDTYCFNDMEPFLVPVNFLLTSPKLQENQSDENNSKNLRLITETRICHILLQTKFLIICKGIFLNEKISQNVKQTLLNGYSNAIRNHKNRVAVITNIVPTFREMMRIHNKKSDPEGQIVSDDLLEAMVTLLIRLGGLINRKIFIPGETRQKQNSREFFIASGTLKILMFFKENFPSLCKQQFEEFSENLNSKDLELYNNSCSTEPKDFMSNSLEQHSRSLTESQIDHKFNLNLSVIDEIKNRRTHRDRFEARILNKIPPTLPKIRK